MNFLNIQQEDESPEEIFDFNNPEDVMIYVIADPISKFSKYNSNWTGYSIEQAIVINSKNPDVIGAASYEQSYGGFLDYTIADMIDCPNQEGWFVVEQVTGYYHKGDWSWGEDDDMEFYFENVRPATQEEIQNYA